jgi:hypothetical protein
MAPIIHSGEVVVGKIGDDLRMDYTTQRHALTIPAESSIF